MHPKLINAIVKWAKDNIHREVSEKMNKEERHRTIYDGDSYVFTYTIRIDAEAMRAFAIACGHPLPKYPWYG